MNTVLRTVRMSASACVKIPPVDQAVIQIPLQVQCGIFSAI